MAITAGNDSWAVRIDDRGLVRVDLRPANKGLGGMTRRQAWELVRALSSALGQDAAASEAAELRAEITRLQTLARVDEFLDDPESGSRQGRP